MYFPRIGFLVLLTTYSSACFAESCTGGVQANGETIKFSGVLRHEERWGPPNFGENPGTDSKFIVWIVDLGKPITILGGAQIGGKSQASVSEIQLNIDPMKFRDEKLQPLDGKMVIAAGKLWRAKSQGDVTPVVVALRTVVPTDKSICRITPDK